MGNMAKCHVLARQTVLAGGRFQLIGVIFAPETAGEVTIPKGLSSDTPDAITESFILGNQDLASDV